MMKRIITFMALLVFVCNAYSQDYSPTSTWPYAYPDFIEGEIQFNGSAPKPGLFNVHILRSALHYIDGDKIMEASLHDVCALRIGQDYYANTVNGLMRVLAKSEGCIVAEHVVVDMVRLNSTGGAYGSSSSTLSTQALSSIEGMGGGTSGTNHMELKYSKDEGIMLPLLAKKYIVVPGLVVYAVKKDVMGVPGIDSKALGDFIKTNKIRWKDPQSLLLVAEYLKNARQ